MWLANYSIRLQAQPVVCPYRAGAYHRYAGGIDFCGEKSNLMWLPLALAGKLHVDNVKNVYKNNELYIDTENTYTV
ncbi:MAG: hypothetical protein ACOX8Q_08540 [Christensenellales bacterium]|jgi:hypothetical protein